MDSSDRKSQWGDAKPFCVDSVNQPPVQPVSSESSEALNDALRRDLFLDLCGDTLPGALVHVYTHRSLQHWCMSCLWGKGVTATWTPPVRQSDVC